MIVVIIAGGSGTRLWPLSTSGYPKQLLNLTNKRSMVQNTYHRARKLSKNIYVIPDVSHAHHIRKQLPALPNDQFIVEPGRRGTANCIIAALAHISRRHGEEEPIAFLSADHHIRDIDGFVHSFNLAAEVSSAKKKIVLVGVEPSYPSTGLGYIERDKETDGFKGVYNISSFKEKPDFALAKKYVSSGNYLWNCGYFVGSISTFLSEMDVSAPRLKRDYEKLVRLEPGTEAYTKMYASFNTQPIEYAMIEKAPELIVVPASFDWMDIGSFKDLHGAVDLDEKENHLTGSSIHTIDIENTYIRNEEKKPVAVIGLEMWLSLTRVTVCWWRART